MENTASEKNSMTHTVDSDRNAVFTLLATWRVVNMARPLKYTPGVRSSAATAKPAADQKNRNVPATMSAVAFQNSAPNSVRPLSKSVT